MENPFENPQDDTDVLVKVSNVKLYLHSWVLSRYSPVFDCMLRGNFKEGITKEIELKGKNAKDIIQMFKMFYPNEDQRIEDSTTTKTLFEFSREYQLKWMGKRIEKYLISKVKSLNDKDKMFFIQATEEHKLGTLKECLLNSNLKPFIELQSMEEFQLLSQNMQYELAKKSLKTLNSYGHRTELEILDEIIYDGVRSENQADVSSEDDREEEIEEETEEEMGDEERLQYCFNIEDVVHFNDDYDDFGYDDDGYDDDGYEAGILNQIMFNEFSHIVRTAKLKQKMNPVKNPFKKSDHNSDVIITCGAYKLHLHSFIISKLSPVLKEQLVEQSPGKYKDIMLDEEPSHLIEMFKYFYANMYPGFTEKSLFKILCNLSDKYKLWWLLQNVHIHLLKDFDFEEDRGGMEKILALHLADVYNWKDLRERIFGMKFEMHSIDRFKCHEEFKELKKQTKYRIVRKIMLLKEKTQRSTYCYDSDDNLTKSYVIRTIDDFNEETKHNEAKQNTKDVETILVKVSKEVSINENDASKKSADDESSEKEKAKMKADENKKNEQKKEITEIKQTENEEVNKKAADNGSSEKEKAKMKADENKKNEQKKEITEIKQTENEEVNKKAADNGISIQAETNNDQTKENKGKENNREVLKKEKESTQMERLLNNRRQLSKYEEEEKKKRKAQKEKELQKDKEYNAIFKFLDTIFLNAQ